MASEELKALVAKLRDTKPRVRRKAIRDIVKLGEAQGINALVKIYQADPDEKVRAEAAKGLAKFKAMDPAAGGKHPAQRLVLARYGLIALLVLLIIGNIALAVTGDGDDESEDFSGPREATERDVLTADITDSLDTLEASTQAILVEIAKETAPDQQPDCDIDISRPDRVSLSRIDAYVYPDIANAVGETSRYQADIEGFNALYRQWVDKCGRLNVQEGLEMATNFQGIADRVSGLRDTVQTLVNNPVPTNAPEDFGKPTRTPIPIPTATPTPEPTTTPTPVPDIDYAPHVDSMLRILENSGAHMERIENFWRDVQNNVDVVNCRTPELDSPYTIPENQRGDANLDAAAERIREGLELAEQNFALFAEQCARRELPSVLDQGLPQIGQARLKFEEARILLESPRGYLEQPSEGE
jgi:hypothetical protein